ncbi:Protein CBG09876 [Caenorhabditis briggsae]|uniref:Protein CBG09876 n=1 Tax=Caenorhabditis briggsae TaxID=6238 RepID=A8X9V6_CAEBR|nr:Protein CBG09876 [Caenorhabditis briggsae]CAP29421.2 Protein CBG09876 [Caenorhabditis briggsae]
MPQNRTDFDDDDLESYLEGSVWSEKPSASEIFSNRPGDVISVFPHASHSNMIYGYPSNFRETVFPTQRGSTDPSYDDYYTKVSTIFKLQAQMEKITERRPRSPGPVAGAGEITNTSHGFTIEIDVFHFLPEEIKVVLTDDTLSISGERFESTGDGHTLRRSFSRFLGREFQMVDNIILESTRSQKTFTWIPSEAISLILEFSSSMALAKDGARLASPLINQLKDTSPEV